MNAKSNKNENKRKKEDATTTINYQWDIPRKEQEGVILDYLMIQGKTATLECAHQLGKLCVARQVLIVNLIPCTSSRRSMLSLAEDDIPPSSKLMQEFQSTLTEFYYLHCTIQQEETTNHHPIIQTKERRICNNKDRRDTSSLCPYDNIQSVMISKKNYNKAIQNSMAQLQIQKQEKQEKEYNHLKRKKNISLSPDETESVMIWKKNQKKAMQSNMKQLEQTQKKQEEVSNHLKRKKIGKKRTVTTRKPIDFNNIENSKQHVVNGDNNERTYYDYNDEHGIWKFLKTIDQEMIRKRNRAKEMMIASNKKEGKETFKSIIASVNNNNINSKESIKRRRKLDQDKLMRIATKNETLLSSPGSSSGQNYSFPDLYLDEDDDDENIIESTVLSPMITEDEDSRFFNDRILKLSDFKNFTTHTKKGTSSGAAILVRRRNVPKFIQRIKDETSRMRIRCDQLKNARDEQSKKKIWIFVETVKRESIRNRERLKRSKHYLKDLNATAVNYSNNNKSNNNQSNIRILQQQQQKQEEQEQDIQKASLTTIIRSSFDEDQNFSENDETSSSNSSLSSSDIISSISSSSSIYQSSEAEILASSAINDSSISSVSMSSALLSTTFRKRYDNIKQPSSNSSSPTKIKDSSRQFTYSTKSGSSNNS